MDLRELVTRLHEVEAVKFGRFKLKSGIESPVYFDLRVIVSHPHLLSAVSEVLWSAVAEDAGRFQSVCGVPYTALPIATLISVNHNIPMLVRRKEAKDYGTKRVIEGKVEMGSECLVVEDVVTSGGSVLETVGALRTAGVGVSRAVVLLDREQGGRENLQREGITLTSVLRLSELLQFLHEEGRVRGEEVEEVQKFLLAHSQLAPPITKTLPPAQSYSARASLCPHPLGRQLLSLMAEKKTNLALSADVSTAQELLQLAEIVGPFICLLKTHVDIIADFSEVTARQLKALSQKHTFVIMEDRKFADIGNTVQLQYQCPCYHMAEEWAGLVTCHALPGPGVITGLKGVAGEGRGCVLVVEMSSEGTLATEEYTKAAVAMAEAHADFVVGVVSRGRVSARSHLLHMTPGVRMGGGGDTLGQQYLTPRRAILECQSDIIIVGRGIYQSPDPVKAAMEYRDEAFTAYQQRLSHES